MTEVGEKSGMMEARWWGQRCFCERALPPRNFRTVDRTMANGFRLHTDFREERSVFRQSVEKFMSDKRDWLISLIWLLRVSASNSRLLSSAQKRIKR